MSPDYINAPTKSTKRRSKKSRRSTSEENE
jgi:hypothetical protein